MEPSRCAVILPGSMFGPYTPLLWYAAEAAEARGASVRVVEWEGLERSAQSRPLEEHVGWVGSQVSPVLDELEALGQRPLVIGKSLATVAAGLVAQRGLAAVWLTPLLTEPVVVDAIARATGHCLLVGGTADRSWDGDLARRLSSEVLEVEGADHGMQVPGRLAESAAVLGQVATAVEDFLDRVAW